MRQRFISRQTSLHVVKQQLSPLCTMYSNTNSRHNHYLLRGWVEELEAAGLGSWAVVREDSLEMVVVGNVIDPTVIESVVGKTNNRIVGIYEDNGMVNMIIEACPKIHTSIKKSVSTQLHIQIDAVKTKERLGLLS